MCYCYCMGMAICLSCLKLWLPHASSLHLCISASLHGPIWIDILNILPPFIPHSGCCKASVGVTSRASSSCHGMSRTKHHQICKNKTRILEAAPQPYHVIPKGWYQLRFSGSDIQLYILLQILSNASSHRFAIQQYNLCSSQLGGILALVLVLNTESGRPSFPSFPPQLDCLEKSLVGLLEQCGVTQVSPQVVPCRSMSFHHLPCAVATHGNKARTFVPPTPPAGISHPNLWKLDFALHTWAGKRCLRLGRLGGLRLGGQAS